MASRIATKWWRRMCCTAPLVLCAVVAEGGDAAVYRCMGEAGRVTYTDLGCVEGERVSLGRPAGRIDPLTEAEAAMVARLAVQARSPTARSRAASAQSPTRRRVDCTAPDDECAATPKREQRSTLRNTSAPRATQVESEPAPPRRHRLPRKRREE